MILRRWISLMQEGFVLQAWEARKIAWGFYFMSFRCDRCWHLRVQWHGAFESDTYSGKWIYIYIYIYVNASNAPSGPISSQKHEKDHDDLLCVASHQLVKSWTKWYYYGNWSFWYDFLNLKVASLPFWVMSLSIVWITILWNIWLTNLSGVDE